MYWDSGLTYCTFCFSKSVASPLATLEWNIEVIVASKVKLTELDLASSWSQPPTHLALLREELAAVLDVSVETEEQPIASFHL